MNKIKYVASLIVLLVVFTACSKLSNLTGGDKLYFCEKYTNDGEVGISDRFTTGYLTVMVKCDYALKLDDVSIQYDKYDDRTGKFEFYKKFSFDVDRDMSYIFFEQNDESDLIFDDEGFYRVFLLDEDDKTIASALIEIID